jgi:hypothetical protein
MAVAVGPVPGPSAAIQAHRTLPVRVASEGSFR